MPDLAGPGSRSVPSGGAVGCPSAVQARGVLGCPDPLPVGLQRGAEAGAEL